MNKPSRDCFRTKQYSDRSLICKRCPDYIACGKPRKKKDELGDVQEPDARAEG